MGNHKGFVLILQSGAGGYLGCAEEDDACSLVSHIDGDGWLFHFQCDGYRRGRHRRSRPTVKLQLIAPFGSPDANAMPAALAAAGDRHCVDYVLACEERSPAKTPGIH
jgi:hypothetical protein